MGGGDGSWVAGVSDGADRQLVTSASSPHVDIWHIAFNMLALWVLGPQLEAALGRWPRFLALYFIPPALAGSTVVYWLSGETSATLGASGATFGLMGRPAGHRRTRSAATCAASCALLAINVVITFAVPNISWQGHLGGFARRRRGRRDPRLRAPHAPAQIQALGLAGVLALAGRC